MGCALRVQKNLRRVHVVHSALSIDGSMQVSIACNSTYELHTAIKTDDFNRVKGLVDIGTDYNGEDLSGSTPLINAIRYANDSISEYLLSLPHIAVHQVNSSGGNALLYAIVGEKDDIVSLLLKKGAIMMVNSHDHFFINELQYSVKLTVVSAACLKGNLPVVKALVGFGVDLNKRIDESVTKSFSPDDELCEFTFPILLACEYGRADVVEYLCDQKVDIKVTDGEECNIFHRLCVIEDEEVSVAMLVKIVGSYLSEYLGLINAPNSLGDSPIHCACKNGRWKLITCLIASGCDHNAQNSINRSTVLHMACERGDDNMIMTLLEAECVVLLRNSQGVRAYEMIGEDVWKILSSHFHLLENNDSLRTTEETRTTEHIHALESTLSIHSEKIAEERANV
jgi:ankyrin repeat protein